MVCWYHCTFRSVCGNQTDDALLGKDQQRPIVQGAADMVSIHWQSPDTGFAKVAGRVAKVM